MCPRILPLRQLTCPLHSIVSPNSTSSSTTLLPLAPVKVRLTGAVVSALDSVIAQRPVLSAVQGLLGATVAPGGRPLSVSTSEGCARPKTAAGWLPLARQGVVEDRTMELPNAQGLGPQVEAAQAGAPGLMGS